MPLCSVWQPAKKRSAVATKTGFARKIDIFLDRHLLSSATRAIAGFLLHQTVTLVIWGQMLELEVYAAGLPDLEKILELDPRFVGAISAELRPKTKTQPLGA
ncbi:MAG: hypothetical protein QOF93_52 [Verrucomicrobiota bacterium]|jgi:hypothetical protein